MARIGRHFRELLKQTLPLNLRSYLKRKRPTDIDQATWNLEFATGMWEDRLSSLLEMPRYAVIAGYCHTIGSAASVLDIGCGAGHLLPWVHRADERSYLGIDISDVAIRQARERASPKAEFQVADAATFNPGGRFDIIVLNEMLYYMKQPEQVLEHYENFLSPGGTIIVSMFQSTDSLRTWRRCAARLVVLDEIRLKRAKATEWHIRLCRPSRLPLDRAD